MCVSREEREKVIETGAFLWPRSCSIPSSITLLVHYCISLRVMFLGSGVSSMLMFKTERRCMRVRVIIGEKAER